MQAVMETTFDLVYLISVIIIGILMVRASSGKSRQFTIFGWMAIILGGGDSFHLIPRVIYTAVLGVGKVVTSVTMTIFYVLLYYVWRERYQIRQHRSLTGIVYLLAAARIVLCLLPQNQWTAENPPEVWGIWRNIPFALLQRKIRLKAGGSGGISHLPCSVWLSSSCSSEAQGGDRILRSAICG